MNTKNNMKMKKEERRMYRGRKFFPSFLLTISNLKYSFGDKNTTIGPARDEKMKTFSHPNFFINIGMTRFIKKDDIDTNMENFDISFTEYPPS